LRYEAYWVFEFCPGKHVRQYHDDKNTKTSTEYFLGYAPLIGDDASNRSDDEVDPPKLTHKGVQVAYYSVNYENGTVCDLSGEERKTKISFICIDNENADYSFISLTETKTCNYELLFATSSLCKHPAFQRPRPNEFEIKCFLEPTENSAQRSLAIPSLYSQFANDDDYQDFMDVLNRGAGLQNLRPVTPKRTVFPTSSAQKVVQKPKKEPEFEMLKLEISDERATMPASKIVEEFLIGGNCLMGISKEGWKLKFCYR
jgi:hypothetical protein